MLEVKFGYWGLQLIAAGSILEQLKELCREYCTDSNLGVVRTLYFHELPYIRDDEERYGWIKTGVGERICVSYYEKQLFFTIEYSNNESLMHVYIKPNSRKALLIGAQYAFLIAMGRECVGLHCVTVICGGQVIALSAPSGTGKTTLSRLLQRYCESAVVNGDFALISNGDKGGVFYEPTPFCGSSGIAHNYRLSISRIVFLEQASSNNWRRLGAKESLIRLLSNTFVPDWDSELSYLIQRNCTNVVDSIPVDLFEFTPKKEAAMLFHDKVT